MKKLKNKSTGGVTIEDTFGGRIGKEGMIGTMDFRDSDGDGTDDRYQKGPGMPDSRGDFGRGKPIIGISPDNLSPGNMAKEEDKKPGRVAGTMMGLAPTQVTQNFRGAGFGMTYGNSRPKTGGTITYGGQPTNQINFAPVMSNVGGNTTVTSGNVNLRGGVGGGGKGGKGGKGGGKGPKDVSAPGFKSIAESGFNPADFGAAGIGMKDYDELKARGYSDKAIKGYAKDMSEQGMQLGGKLQARLGLDGGIGKNFNPADYGAAGLGMKDYEELTNRGYTDNQIKQYAQEQAAGGLQIGGKLSDQLGLGGGGGAPSQPTGGGKGPQGGTDTSKPGGGGGQSQPSGGGKSTGGQESQTAGGSQQQTVRGLRDLDTGVSTYNSINDAKNVVNAYRAANNQAPKDISDRQINKVISRAGIRNFNSKNDAKTLTNYLINRSAQKSGQGGGGAKKEQQPVAKGPQPKAEGVSIQNKLKREIKKATGQRPNEAQFKKIIARANVGKKLNLKDVKKVVNAAKKAKAVVNRRKKQAKRNKNKRRGRK